jgi:hypothetical protein
MTAGKQEDNHGDIPEVQSVQSSGNQWPIYANAEGIWDNFSEKYSRKH